MNNIKLILFTAFFVIILLLVLSYFTYKYFVTETVKSTITSVSSGNVIDILPNKLKSKIVVLSDLDTETLKSISTLSPTLITSLKNIAENPQSVIPESLEPLLNLTSTQMNNLVNIATRQSI